MCNHILTQYTHIILGKCLLISNTPNIYEEIYLVRPIYYITNARKEALMESKITSGTHRTLLSQVHCISTAS